MRRKTARKWFVFGLWSALLFMSAWAGWRMLLEADFLRVRHLRVQETEHISATKVRTTFAQALGQNLLMLDLERMMEELRGDTWVGRVAVRRILPDTLLVQVSERVALASAGFKEGVYGVDEQGLILDPNGGAFATLPRIEGLSFQGMVGGEIDSMENFRRGLYLLSLADGYQDIIGSKGVGVADFRTGSDDPKLHMQGFMLRFGHGDYEAKWDRFMSVYRDLKSRGLAPEEVDLRFEDQVVVKTF